MSNVPNILFQNIQEARIILREKVTETPLISIHDEVTPHGNPIYLKAENLQPSGSFKIRGASYCLSRLTRAQRAAGVVAYSTGNHAQAVALVAKQLGVAATIVMSPDAPDFKVAATRNYGANIVMAAASSPAKDASDE